MRFLINVIDSKARSGTSDEMAAIDAFNDKLQANGNWILACGVTSPSEATVIDNRDDAGFQAAGPLYDSIEFVAGFWLIKADSEADALALAHEGSKACNRKVEVRPIIGG